MASSISFAIRPCWSWTISSNTFLIVNAVGAALLLSQLLARFHWSLDRILNNWGGRAANIFLAVLKVSKAWACSAVKRSVCEESNLNRWVFFAHRVSNSALNLSSPESKYALMLASPRPMVPLTSAIMPSKALRWALASRFFSISIIFVIFVVRSLACGAAWLNRIFRAGWFSFVWAIFSISC